MSYASFPLFTRVVYNPANLSFATLKACQDIESGLFVEQSAWVDKKLQEMCQPKLMPLSPCPIAWLKRSSNDFELLEKKHNSVLKKRTIEESSDYIYHEYGNPSVGVKTSNTFADYTSSPTSKEEVDQLAEDLEHLFEIEDSHLRFV